MPNFTPRYRHHELGGGGSFEVRSGDLLLRLLRLRGWRLGGTVNGSVELTARLPLPGGDELSVSSVGASKPEAVTSLFVKACEAQSRSRLRLVAGPAADDERVHLRAS